MSKGPYVHPYLRMDQKMIDASRIQDLEARLEAMTLQHAAALEAVGEANEKVQALVEAIKDALDANPTELNLGNYGHDEVCNLQNEAIDVCQILTAALAALEVKG